MLLASRHPRSSAPFGEPTSAQDAQALENLAGYDPGKLRTVLYSYYSGRVIPKILARSLSP